MSNKTLPELEAYKARLEGDVRRSRMIDPDGMRRGTPLMRNLEQVNKDIEAAKAVSAPATLSEGTVSEKMIASGSHQHMLFALHHHHSTGGSHDATRTSLHPDYHFHFIGATNHEEKMPAPGPATHSAPVHHYIVIHKHHAEGTVAQSHHFTVRHNKGGNLEINHQKQIS